MIIDLSLWEKREVEKKGDLEIEQGRGRRGCDDGRTDGWRKEGRTAGGKERGWVGWEEGKRKQEGWGGRVGGGREKGSQVRVSVFTVWTAHEQKRRGNISRYHGDVGGWTLDFQSPILTTSRRTFCGVDSAVTLSSHWSQNKDGLTCGLEAGEAGSFSPSACLTPSSFHVDLFYILFSCLFQKIDCFFSVFVIPWFAKYKVLAQNCTDG